MRIKFIKNIVNVLRGKKVEKWVGNSILIDDQGKLKKYHGKRIKVSIAGNNNEIILNKKDLKKRLDFTINITGNNNKVKIGKIGTGKFSLTMVGHGHTFCSGDSNYTVNLTILMGTRWNNDNIMSENLSITIGKDCAFSGADLIVYNKNNSISIGDDCAFSNEVFVQAGDGHQILQHSTGKVLNNNRYNIVIGNHCWIGRRVFVLKNAQINANCIVGANSLVTKKFSEQYVVIAGNPAKIIKDDIEWDRRTVFD